MIASRHLASTAGGGRERLDGRSGVAHADFTAGAMVNRDSPFMNAIGPTHARPEAPVSAVDRYSRNEKSDLQGRLLFLETACVAEKHDTGLTAFSPDASRAALPQFLL